MLTLLKIKNLALVEDLFWEVGPGLVGITGETGAGKSVIIGALKLIIGERADRGLIRTGSDSCSVEAVFDLTNAEEVNTILAEAGLGPCDENQLVMRRVIDKQSTNKQFINCSPVTLMTLKKIGHSLVDLHGPHDHQSLLSQERQLALLDAYAGSIKEASEYTSAFKNWKSLQAEHDELLNSERSNEQAIDLLKHQINEINVAEIQLNEEDELHRRYQITSNSKQLLEISRQITITLEGKDDSVLGKLMQLTRLVRELEKYDPSTTRFTNGFDSALVEIEELESNMRNYIEGIEMDPSALAALESRVDLLETLKRKYGNTLKDVLVFRDNNKIKLTQTENREDELKRLNNAITKAKSKMKTASQKLTTKRARSAPKLARQIANHLEELGFKKASFQIAIKSLKMPSASGEQTVEFMFSPNLGEPLKELRSIASSGEMSRVMLAVKSTLAREDAIPVLVFDEIDANVGGAIAQAVGIKMASLGTTHQVLSISHLPQVASLSTSHYVVKKEFTKNGRTRSCMSKVEGEKRIAEIARMLGGNKKSAQQHAQNLIRAAA